MVCPWVENGTLADYLDRRNNILTAQMKFCMVSIFNILVNSFEYRPHRSTTSLWDYSIVSDFFNAKPV